MGKVTPRRVGGQKFVVSLAALTLLGPLAWGYINGGDYRNTLATFEKSLKSSGWGAYFGGPIRGTNLRGVGGVAFVPPDNPDHERYVNRLVGQAVQSLPEKDADRISVEDKREVARLAREAIKKASADNSTVIKTGQTGSLHYQVGAYSFQKYWETNYGGKRKTYERQSGLSPFVALKVVAR